MKNIKMHYEIPKELIKNSRIFLNIDNTILLENAKLLIIYVIDKYISGV